MDPLKSLQIQKQIRENNLSINEYYKDLLNWQKDISQKDKIIVDNFKIKEKSNEESEIKNSKPVKIQNQIAKEKLKRDINSIKDYYDHWDKIDVEEEIEKSDNNNNTKLTKMMSNQKSNAKTNSQIIMTNNRIKYSNENYIEKLKNEANAYFAIKNFNKSIELYNNVLEIIEKEDNSKYEKSKLTVLNNKGNSYLKLNLYKEAINEFNKVLLSDKINTKALFRRGLCYMKLNQPILAMNDLVESLKLLKENCDNEKKIIEEHIEECLKNINSLIKKEKNSLNRFEYSEKTNFKKLNTKEINIEKQIIFSNKNNIEEKKENIHTVELSDKDIIKFVYDITKENLTSSTFKYGLRNLKGFEEKEEFLKKINPTYLPKIFINDIEKDLLLDIFSCLKNMLINCRSNEKCVYEYLKNITKIGRFKLVIKLMLKKEKAIINEIFELFKGINDSDLMSLKDIYVY